MSLGQGNMFQFHKVRLKEAVYGMRGLVFTVFQFHKVRLKEIRKYMMTGIIVFQFHKVRLKVSHRLQRADRKRSFQFHKVRLKVRAEMDSGEEYQCFNSIRYD